MPEEKKNKKEKGKKSNSAGKKQAEARKKTVASTGRKSAKAAAAPKNKRDNGKKSAAAKKSGTEAKKKAGSGHKKARPAAKKNGSGAGESGSALKPVKRRSGPTGGSRSSQSDDSPTFIVGMGSSAGGLEAMKDFFQEMPANSGMAFVLVPHLDPSAKSVLHELLQNYTDMPVVQTIDDTEVAANSVYVIPPDRMLGIIHGHLMLMQSEEKRGLRHPIDYFFRSLAQDRLDNAIGIILSGTGSEGVLGAQAIKGEGGLVIAQDPDTTKFDSMPRSVIDADLADWTLAPKMMPDKLLSYSRKKYREEHRPEDRFTDDGLKKLFLIIRGRTGHDFSFYKPSTLMRRITRRMDINQIEEVDDYINYAGKNPAEVELLFRELLIRVTNFFRDPAAFNVLQEKVLPHIIQEVNSEEPIRVWIPACSTGEEAYSIAMVLDEYMQSSKEYRKFQIFATDIDEEAVEKARRGVYPESIDVDVSPERLKRYFTKKEHAYEINKGIRENIVFAVQNIIKDPPLSRMDLICCRNLLIYFNTRLQQKVINVFHYAMKPGGILFLGASESVSAKPDQFQVMDSKWKIFKTVGKSSYRHGLHLPASHTQNATEQNGAAMAERWRPSLDELIRNMLLDTYAPACVIMKEEGSILYFFGRTGKYLEPAPGQAKLNIYDMARQGLKTPLVECVKRVRQGQEETYCPDILVRTNGGTTTCKLTVKRVREPQQLAGLVLVVFEEVPEPKAEREKQKKGGRADVKSRGRIAELENELKNVREHLQTTIEELETSNEELQSTNEELQSSNEELETSREELQSVNEELMTVNAEAQEKINQLAQARNEMVNLLAATEIASLFVDQDMCVKNFTPDATRIFKLIQTDIGRPISDVTNSLKYDNLVEDMLKVLDTLIPIEKQILDSNGFWYLMKIIPYRTEKRTIEGVVVNFVDISKQKHAEIMLDESEEQRSSILDQSGEGFILIDYESGSITDSNAEFQKMTGRHAWELKKMNIWDLVPRKDKKKTEKKYLEESIKNLEKGRKEKLLGPDGDAREFHISTRMISIGDRKYLQCFLTPA